MSEGKIVALAGGVGAARFLEGLARVCAPQRLFVIGNTGDDTEMHGLHISPDLDTVVYTLAGLHHRERGWGLKGDTFHCLEALGRLGAETWFQLGDRDLATHIYRTRRLREGARLSEITHEIAARLRVRAAVTPVTDDPLRTLVRTRAGRLDFQTWFVRRRARDRVLGLEFEGAKQARPAPGVIEAIREAWAVIVCPSNPFLSVGPILAVPGVREALRTTAAPVAAISPIVGGRALKGPAASMLRSMGHPVSPAGVAEMYRDFAGVCVFDRVDVRYSREIEAMGMLAVPAGTVMTTLARKRSLARAVLRAVGLR